MKLSRLFISFCIGVLFFVFGVADLPNYGPNWDEPVHFGRGQAIVQFFLTSKKDYKSLSLKESVRRSYYQYDDYSYTFFEQKFNNTEKFLAGTGHPVLSDVLAAVFNRVFYQTLNIVGDVEAYHLYGITLAAVLVGVLYFFVSSIYGSFSGLVSVLSLALTPLFLGESRFNIKDIPEAVFYAWTLLTFYQGIIKNNWKWIVLSSFFAGLAFGTKLNIIFAAFSAGIWVFVVYLNVIQRKGWKEFFMSRKSVLLSFLSYPIVSLILYFGSWPILWKDPIVRFLYNLNYYKTIGTGGASTGFTSIFGINTYAIQWIFFSTPLVILILSSVGIFAGIRIKEKRLFFLLVLLWFLVPIIRVSLPSASIYGGVRQIMEYIPAMAILAGIGAGQIVTWLVSYLVAWFTIPKRKQAGVVLLQWVVILSFVPITLKIISMHPNESVYLNPLIGGLKGAKERNIPGWGNSLGSTYRQGVRWLNAHAQPNAKLATVYELRSNIALIDLRSDIDFQNRYRSVIHRDGEYIIGVTHDESYETSYSRLYVERYLDPVYQLVVDGVPLLKIWKNDLEHTKEAYKKDEQILTDFTVAKDQRRLLIDFGGVIKLTRILIEYESANCQFPVSGHFEYSNNKKKWQSIPGDLTVLPLIPMFNPQPTPGVLEYLFAAQDARYLRIMVGDQNSCLLRKPLTIQLFHI